MWLNHLYDTIETESECLQNLKKFFESDLGQMISKELKKEYHDDQYNALKPHRIIYETVNDYLSSEENENLFFKNLKYLYLIFIQVNSLGPSFTILLPHEKAVNDRIQEVNTLFNFYFQKPAATSDWDDILLFWRNAPFGCPDDRIGESTSTQLNDNELFNLNQDLAIDGEVILDSVKGVGYLWVTVQMALSYYEKYKDYQNATECRKHINSLFLLATIFFVWRQSLTGVDSSSCVHLMYICVFVFSEILYSIQIIPEPLNCSYFFKNESILTSLNSLCNLDQLRNIKEVIPLCTQDIMMIRANKIKLFSQFITYLCYFKKIDFAKSLIETQMESMIGIQFQFDSVLGKRREQQANAVPQLVLRVIKKSENLNLLENPIFNSDKEWKNINNDKDFFNNTPMINNIKLKQSDPLSDLFERISFEETCPDDVMYPLDNDEIMLLLSYCYVLYEYFPYGDTISLNQLHCCIDRCCVPRTSNLNYGLYFSILWFRCMIEVHRIKTQDRVYHQLLALLDSYWDRSISYQDRYAYCYQIPYLFRHTRALLTGKHMMKIGMNMASFEMYKELWMWEEAVEALIHAQRKNAAFDLAEKRLKIMKTPHLLCCLGNLQNKPEYYEEAWILSKEKYARAQQSFGFYWFSQGNMSKTIESLNLSLKLNPLFENIWFTLGCAYIAENSLDLALQAFSQVVSINPNSSKGWNNMAAIHFQNERWKEAFFCINEAVKHIDYNYELWDTYVKISVKIGSPIHCIRGIKALIHMNLKHLVEDWVFSFLSDTVLTLLQNKNYSRDSHIIKTIENFFMDIVENTYGDRQHIFSAYAEIASYLKDYRLSVSMRQKQLRAYIVRVNPSKFHTFNNSLPESMDESILSETQTSLSQVLNDVLQSCLEWKSSDTQNNDDQGQKIVYDILDGLRDFKLILVDKHHGFQKSTDFIDFMIEEIECKSSA